MQYQIGDFARMAQISHKQLKYYEQCGLIAPARIDPDSGYRYYDASQLRTVAHIRAFMGMGFATAEIKELLTAAERDYASAFTKKQAELEAGVEEYRRKLSMLSFYRDAMRAGGFNQPYRAAVKTTISGLMAVKRHTFANINALEEAWQTLYAEALRAGAAVAPSIIGLTRFYDKKFEIENFDAELFLLLDRRGGESPVFEYARLEPVRAVSVIHRGGYDFLNEAYAFAYMWIDRNGCRAAGLPMEAYHCEPAPGRPESEYVTELYIPIEPL